MAKKHLKRLLLAIITTLAIGVSGLCLNLTSVKAESSPATTDNAFHLQVSPVKQKLALDPGESYVSSFKVTNIGTEKFTYTTSVAPYTVIDENYSANYEDKENAYSQMSEWITFEEGKASGELEPGATVEVPFTITVPKDVPSGGQYATILAETSDGGQDSTIQTVNRVGMILYAKVSGETRETGSIINNTVNTFMFEPPIAVSSLIENTGNVETTASYVLKVWPLFSGETVYNNEDRPTALDIVPDSRRFNSMSWEGSPRLGVFTVEQTITYLGETSTVKKLVIICPIWFMLIVLAIFFFLIFWLVSRIVARRKARKLDSQQVNNKENTL